MEHKHIHETIEVPSATVQRFAAEAILISESNRRKVRSLIQQPRNDDQLWTSKTRDRPQSNFDVELQDAIVLLSLCPRRKGTLSSTSFVDGTDTYSPASSVDTFQKLIALTRRSTRILRHSAAPPGQLLQARAACWS